MTHTKFRWLFAGAATLTVASMAQAQTINLAPTDGGSQWQVACTATAPGLINDGQPAHSSLCNGTFSNAVRVFPEAAGWVATPVGGSYWIGRTGSGSLWADAPNENPHYQYTFRTYVDLTTVSSNTMGITLDALHLDNYWVGWSVNGGAVSALGVTPPPLVPNGGNWTTAFSLSATSSDFVAGSSSNYIDFIISGNGRTDAFLAKGYLTVMDQPPAVVTPEPGSLLLVAGGLGLVGVAVRRRRTGTA